MQMLDFKMEREFLLKETTMGEIQEEIKENVEMPDGNDVINKLWLHNTIM